MAFIWENPPWTENTEIKNLIKLNLYENLSEYKPEEEYGYPPARPVSYLDIYA